MRRGAIAVWIIVTLVAWGFVEVWPQDGQIPGPKQRGILKSIEKEGFISRIYVGDGMVTAYNVPENLKPGDKVEVQGDFVNVLSLKNQGYARHLKSQGVHWTGRARSWTNMQQIQPFYFWRNEAKIRLSEAIDFLYRGDGFLVKALLYGDKKELDERIKEDFARTGTAHVLALSGFHTGILALLFHKLLVFVPAKQRSFFIGVFLLIYCFFTGMRPSILRATVFFLLLYGSFLVVRSYDVISAAAITASVFIAYNPYVLYDIGFQLSFLSVVSIGMFLPMMESWAKRKVSSTETYSTKIGKSVRETSLQGKASGDSRSTVPEEGKQMLQDKRNFSVKEKAKPYGHFGVIVGKYNGKPQETLRLETKNETKQWLFSAVLVTISAQVLTLPVVAFYFHQVSLISIVANVIVLPGITLLMTGFIFSLLILPFFSPGSQMLAGVCRILMKELLNFVKILGSWRWAALDTGEIPLWIVMTILLVGILCWKLWEFTTILKNKIVLP